MKNKFVRLMGFAPMIFFFNLFSMNMTPQQVERSKRLLKRPVDQVKLSTKHKPDTYFIHQQGTSKGVYIDQTLLEDKSQMVKDMKDAVDKKSNQIGVPFSQHTIQRFVDYLEDKIKLTRLSLQELDSLIKIEQLFLLSEETINKVSMQHSQELKNVSLERLVLLCNHVDFSNLGKQNLVNEVARRMYVTVSKIESIFSSYKEWRFNQATGDMKGQFSLEKYHYPKCSEYKVLLNLNKDLGQQVKELFVEDCKNNLLSHKLGVMYDYIDSKSDVLKVNDIMSLEKEKNWRALVNQFGTIGELVNFLCGGVRESIERDEKQRKSLWFFQR